MLIGDTATVRTVECILVTSFLQDTHAELVVKVWALENLGDRMQLIRVPPGSSITVGGRRRTRSRIFFDGATFRYVIVRVRAIDV
jgi:hypothetical protein